MKIKIPALRKNERCENQLVVLLAAADPNPTILKLLSQEQNIRLKEAFTTQGLIQELPETNLVIRGRLIEVSAISQEPVQQEYHECAASNPFLLSATRAKLFRKRSGFS